MGHYDDCYEFDEVESDVEQLRERYPDWEFEFHRKRPEGYKPVHLDVELDTSGFNNIKGPDNFKYKKSKKDKSKDNSIKFITLKDVFITAMVCKMHGLDEGRKISLNELSHYASQVVSYLPKNYILNDSRNEYDDFIEKYSDIMKPERDDKGIQYLSLKSGVTYDILREYRSCQSITMDLAEAMIKAYDVLT